jgi:hypothetical protein
MGTVRTLPRAEPGSRTEAAVLTKAVLRTADALALDGRSLAAILGLSEATISRMRAGTYRLSPGDKSFELAALLVRAFRSLDSVLGGDTAAARAWLRADNLALGGPPLARLRTVTGLTNVVRYLDARRAVL